MHPSNKAILTCAMYETAHVLENLQEAYGLLSFVCITIWQTATYTLEAAYSSKLHAMKPI
jgi:hypothetical protein